MHDALENGRQIRILNIIDDYNREAVAVDAQYSYPSEYVVRCLEIIAPERGLHRQIRVDNGPEFLGKAFKKYCKDNNIDIHYIQPGKPTQNAYIERLNRLYREDILDAYLFNGIEQVRILSEKWKSDYNKNHSHSSLGGTSPFKYLVAKGNDSSENVKAEMNDSLQSSALTLSPESIGLHLPDI
jgi:putative transposase